MPDTKQAGIDVNWELANENARAWAQRHSAQLVTNITEVTRDKIRRSVASYVEKGETLDQLRARIEKTGAFSPARAQLIAVTEVTDSYAQGELASAKESGVRRGE